MGPVQVRVPPQVPDCYRGNRGITVPALFTGLKLVAAQCEETHEGPPQEAGGPAARSNISDWSTALHVHVTVLHVHVTGSLSTIIKFVYLIFICYS